MRRSRWHTTGQVTSSDNVDVGQVTLDAEEGVLGLAIPLLT